MSGSERPGPSDDPCHDSDSTAGGKAIGCRIIDHARFSTRPVVAVQVTVWPIDQQAAQWALLIGPSRRWQAACTETRESGLWPLNQPPKPL